MDDAVRKDPAENSGSLDAARDLSTVDWTLFVQTGQVDGKKTLHYSLTTRERQLEDLGFVTLKVDLQSFFHSFFEEIDHLPAVDVDSREDILHSNGRQLAEMLLTPKLADRLQALRGRATSAQILSDEHSIPWELLRLPGLEGGPDFFLCEAFAMTRWRRGVENRLRLPLRHPALVAIEAADLPAIQDELTQLENVFNGAGRRLYPIAPTYREITEAMGSAAYDGWHFTGHGAIGGEDPDQWAIQLNDHTQLTPRRLYGKAQTLGRQHAPFVFLNCCHSGKGGQSLTKIGGWAEQFLKLGAGAFVGASWETTDEAAKDFAVIFYREFLGGAPICEAARRARLAIRANFPGDPTWLAFTVFAHPYTMVGEPVGEAEAPRLSPPPIMVAAPPPRAYAPAPTRSRSPATAGPARAAARAQPRLPWPWIGGGVLLTLVLVMFLVTQIPKEEQIAPRDIEEVAPGEGGSIKPPPPAELEEESATTTATTKVITPPPPPPPPKVEITMAPIESGKVGVAAIDKKSLAWDSEVTRILSRQLREQKPNLTPVTVPEALRSKLGALRDGDLSVLPGGDRAPSGFEYLLIMAESHAPKGGASFPTVSVTCDVVVVSTRQPEIRLDQSFNHLGQNPEESGALEQAFGRCVTESISGLP